MLSAFALIFDVPVLALALHFVSREGLAPIVKAYSRLIPVDGLVL